MHHFVANAPWQEIAVLRVARDLVLGEMERHGPVAAWVVDDTGFPKKGQHSVGVARQYCGVLGKQDNCQVAVSVSLANDAISVPAAYQLYLPEAWVKDGKRRRAAGVPPEMVFRTWHGHGVPRSADDSARALYRRGDRRDQRVAPRPAAITAVEAARPGSAGHALAPESAPSTGAGGCPGDDVDPLAVGHRRVAGRHARADALALRVLPRAARPSRRATNGPASGGVVGDRMARR